MGAGGGRREIGVGDTTGATVGGEEEGAGEDERDLCLENIRLKMEEDSFLGGLSGFSSFANPLDGLGGLGGGPPFPPPPTTLALAVIGMLSSSLRGLGNSLEYFSQISACRAAADKGCE